MPAAPELLSRVRDALASRHPREVRMFGGVSFMVDERMVVACRRDGGLLVRVDPADGPDLLAEPGARPAVMGEHRPMGPGWISVEADALTGRGLDAWLARALAYHASQG